MTRTALFALAALAVAGAAQAQAPPPAAGAPPALPPAPPRLRGPATAWAVQAAQEAIAACLANTYKVTALIVDSNGDTVALISGDGAAARTTGIAATKAAVVMKYKVPSGVIVQRATTDKALAAELAADPKIGTARQGAIPLTVGNEFVGAFAVSGAPGGDKDEACARAALAKVGSGLK